MNERTGAGSRKAAAIPPGQIAILPSSTVSLDCFAAALTACPKKDPAGIDSCPW